MKLLINQLFCSVVTQRMMPVSTENLSYSLKDMSIHDTGNFIALHFSIVLTVLNTFATKQVLQMPHIKVPPPDPIPILFTQLHSPV